ncbi:hypothetical protein Barb6_01213 [Bacteroidales bacterium Barb6]|nr:hypothetical protein Barb6_01213 [Bacteroidales bacterium Barb6]
MYNQLFIIMKTTSYDEITDTGKNTVQEPAAVYKLNKTTLPGIPLDENGVSIGYTWEETQNMMYDILSEHYGMDLRTL